MAETDSILWSPTTTMDVVENWEAVNAKREPQNELDKDAFLKLMMTQMKYQDPLNPMDNQQFLAQMAQFTSLEQMVNLNTAYSKSQAYGMLGKQIEGTYTNPVTEQTEDVAGTVTAVTTKAGEVYLLIDDEKEVPLSSVTAVGQEYLDTALLNSIATDAANTRAQGMVGKNIQAVIYKDGKAVDYIEGVVDYVKFEGMETVLMVDGKEVLPHEVASVADPGEEKPFIIGRSIDISVPDKDGVYKPYSGEITGVNIINGKAVLQVKTGSGVLDVPVKMLNYVQDSLAQIGRDITYNSISGEVTGVVFKNSLPYLQVETAVLDDKGKPVLGEDGEEKTEIKEVSYEAFINKDSGKDSEEK